MKLSEFKQELVNGRQLSFQLPNGEMVPPHFHITEIGVSTKEFIDCGGTMRSDKKIVFQLWYSIDKDHRLSTEKMLQVIQIGEEKIGLANLPIEVEYQDDTIGKFNIGNSENHFTLLATQTACLAEDKCGIPEAKQKIQLADISGSCCSPESGCC